MSDRLAVRQVYVRCLSAWKRDFWRLTLLAGLVLLPLLLVEFALYGAAGIDISTDDDLSLWIVSVPVFVYSVESHHFLSGLIERLEAAARMGHERPEIGTLLRELPWVRLFWADMLFTLVFIVGLALAIVPGIIVGTVFALVMPLINLERQPVLATFGRSYRLVRGNFWRVLLAWLPVWAVTTAVSQALSEALGHLGHSKMVQMLAHLLPEMVLLPIIALPAVIVTFALVDRDRTEHDVTTIRP